MYSRLRNLPNMVEDVLKGTVLTNPGITLLEGERVVLRRDQEELRGKVKVVAGGGTGREPWPAGYVGQGLLAAAVLGEPNTAPPPRAILRAFRHLACGHFQGILVIVRNITGNRLNFGAAVERARADDIDVRLLLVGTVTRPPDKRRALSDIDGAIVLCKVAGAMAESGCSLDEIYHLCHYLAANDLSIVCASLAAPPPGAADADAHFHFSKKQLAGPAAPPPSVCPEVAIRAALDVVVEDASDGNRRIDPDHPLVVFVDNAGKSPKQEESVVVWETVSYLRELGYDVPRTYSSAFVTSPEEAVFFITLLRVSYTCVLKYLDAPTTAVSWPHHFRFTAEDGQTVTVELPLVVEPAVSDADEDSLLEPEYTVTDKFASCVLQVIKCTTKSLIDCEKQLNLYDEFGGGRDCGTNVKKVAKAIERAVNIGDLDGHNLFKLFRDLSRTVESTRAGVTALLYAIFFEAAAKAFSDIEEQEAICEERWLQALEFGVEGLFRCTSSPSAKGTMLDALLAAINEWHKQLAEGEDLTSDWVTRLGAVVKAAENAALRTAELRPDTGTSVIPDPGAYTVGVWLRTSYEVSLMLF